MNYGRIKKYDIANGEGVRVSLFVSGCTHHCRGCFNKQTWDFNFGRLFTDSVQEEIIRALDNEYINGLSILGGEPFEIENQRSLCPFIKKVKNTFPYKSIWCYSGYTFERDILKGGRVFCECTYELLENIDVLVDGEFIENLKNISISFRGSENQRIIDVKESLKEGRTVLFKTFS